MVAREIPTSSTQSYTPQGSDNRPSFPDLFPPPPAPPTELGRHRIFAPKAGVRVSPLALGAMSIGDQWTGIMGNPVGKDKAFEIMDAFYEAGGNFIDTANNYQDEQSEVIVGEWMKERNNRDEIVLATKYTTFGLDRADGPYKGIRSNFFGNHKKNMLHSVERSLAKLQTNYIDILFLHWWDYSTSIEELMQSLNDLVRSGKVLYLGISDTPAWIVAQANQYARDHGMAQFVVYQGKWSVADRDVERDVIPMCREFGMAFLAWNVLGGGMFKTPEELKERASTLRGGMQPSEQQLAVAKVLAKVAEEVGAKGNLTGVALAWARQKYIHTYPLVGGSKVSHLKGNIDALTISLSQEQISELDGAIPYDAGFPMNQFGTDPRLQANRRPADNFLIMTSANLQYD